MQGAFEVPSTLLMMFSFSAVDSGLRFMPIVNVAIFKGGLKKTTCKIYY
jgi:hypothetical protein